MGAVMKRKKRSCGLCKPRKTGGEKRDLKFKGGVPMTRQDIRKELVDYSD